MLTNVWKAIMVVIVMPRVTTQKVLTTVFANQDFMEMEKTAAKVRRYISRSICLLMEENPM